MAGYTRPSFVSGWPDTASSASPASAARDRLLEVDIETRRTPPRGSIQQWLEQHGVRDRFEMMGRPPVGKGSGKAKAGAGQYRLYDTYEAARRSARAGRFADRRDYLACCKAHDPRLPADPDVKFADEFRRDGWPAFLGTGPSRQELAGLVQAARVRSVLGLGHPRFKRLFAPLESGALRLPRRDGDSFYFAPEAVVALAISEGLIESSAENDLLATLRVKAEPAVE